MPSGNAPGVARSTITSPASFITAGFGVGACGRSSGFACCARPPAESARHATTGKSFTFNTSQELIFIWNWNSLTGNLFLSPQLDYPRACKVAKSGRKNVPLLQDKTRSRLKYKGHSYASNQNEPHRPRRNPARCSLPSRNGPVVGSAQHRQRLQRHLHAEAASRSQDRHLQVRGPRVSRLRARVSHRARRG